MNLRSVADEAIRDTEKRTPKGESLETHRRHCKAKPGNCPFEKHFDDVDRLVDESLEAAKMDAAYADAVKRGDRETALRMVREAAAKAMPDTKVVDEDGLPLVVYHSGTFGVEDTIPVVGMEGMHFGTKKASSDRRATKLAEEFRTTQHVSAFRAGDGLWYYITDHLGPYEYNSFENGAEGWNSENEALFAGEESLELEAENSSEEDYGYCTTACFLNISKPHKNRDEDTYWEGSVLRAKDSGYDGIEYENMFEDRGSTSYIAFSPSQIKSADITYDDDHNLIPLSRRFDFSNDDIRF